MKFVLYDQDKFLMKLSAAIADAGGNTKVRFVDLTPDEYHQLRCDAQDLPIQTPTSELRHVSTIRGVTLRVNGVAVDDLVREEFQRQLEARLEEMQREQAGDGETPPRLQ